jgi:hypothetical protein
LKREFLKGWEKNEALMEHRLPGEKYGKIGDKVEPE